VQNLLWYCQAVGKQATVFVILRHLPDADYPAKTLAPPTRHLGKHQTTKATMRKPMINLTMSEVVLSISLALDYLDHRLPLLPKHAAKLP
jgi:hypothetical protein